VIATELPTHRTSIREQPSCPQIFEQTSDGHIDLVGAFSTSVVNCCQAAREAPLNRKNSGRLEQNTQRYIQSKYHDPA
jgi:hypothetical protein